MAHSNLQNVLAPWISTQRALPCCSLASFNVLSAPLFGSLMPIVVSFYKPLFKLKYKSLEQSGWIELLCLHLFSPASDAQNKRDFNQVWS